MIGNGDPSENAIAERANDITKNEPGAHHVVPLIALKKAHLNRLKRHRDLTPNNQPFALTINLVSLREETTTRLFPRFLFGT